MTRTPLALFLIFLRLGLTSFGGPVAHLGYFRDEFVTRRQWLGDAAYAELVALCQFLPGPASSQTGFALGLMRGGWAGAVAAFVGFTAPSAVAMLAFAGLASVGGGRVGAGALHGLKIVAVAIVAQAVWGMARNLCPDLPRAVIAAGAVALLAVLPGAAAMPLALLAGAAAGMAMGPWGRAGTEDALHLPVTRAQGRVALIVFVLLLAVLPLAAPALAPFFRAGSLVFGGGHVVLPLLEQAVVGPGRIDADRFLAGYGAAQALPGPLFAFAAYLGAVIGPGIAAGLAAMLALFLPGFLLLIAALPYWSALRRLPVAQAAIQGANAAVVGVLAAALYDPVFPPGIRDARDLGLAVALFIALMVARAPAWAVVALGALGGIGLAAL